MTDTKQKIANAAVYLFNTKGYDGTSVRDIANKAKVNVANISYYYRNKQGLLESCITTYFEQYFHKLEHSLQSLDEQGATVCLKQLVKEVLYFKREHVQLTRLVLREVSIDSQMVREIMSTYFMKERHYFKKIIDIGIRSGEFKGVSTPYVIIQLKGMLDMPFLNTHYLVEVLNVYPQEKFFIDKLIEEIYQWIDLRLCLSVERNILKALI